MCRILFYLTIVILLCTKFALAGQSVEHFSNKVQSRNNGWQMSLQWLDSNLKGLDNNTNLRIQEYQSANYYLYAYRIDGGNNAPVVTSQLQIIEPEFLESKLDITISPASCKFSSENKLCSIGLKDLGSPNGDVARQVYYAGESSIAFPASYKDISIIASAGGGEIEGTGPNNRLNILTAIAVSDNPKQDNVALKLQVKGGGDLQQIHLEFEVEDVAVADFEGRKTQSCDIKFKDNAPLVCDKLIQVTPYVVGKTRINFISKKSYWIAKGSTLQNEYTSLKPIQVNVGTLFAGYSGARVYRKGSKEYAIQEYSSSTVCSVAVDQPSHKLYVLTPEQVYKQESATTKQLDLTNLSEIPAKNGQTLGLTDVANRIVVGNRDGQLFRIIDNSSDVKVSLLANMPASLLWSTIDKENNITYFVDSKNSLGIYYSRYQNNFSDKFEATKNVIDLKKYESMLVAANNNAVYAAGTEAGGNKLFAWIKNVMAQVKINNNPFTQTSYISMLVFHHDCLYAGTSDGKLYYLNREKDTFEWQLVATTDGEIIDSAIDMNGNIYLANKKNGVWKVPFNIKDNINNPAYKISNYSQDKNAQALTVNTIAIDNNI